jgi:hypothetical protein
VPKVGAPQSNTYKEYYATENFGRENSIYDVKLGNRTLGTFSPFVFTFRLPAFLYFYGPVEWWEKQKVRGNG